MDGQTVKIEVELDENELNWVDEVRNVFRIELRSEAIKEIIRSHSSLISRLEKDQKAIKKYQNKIDKLRKDRIRLITNPNTQMLSTKNQ